MGLIEYILSVLALVLLLFLVAYVEGIHQETEGIYKEIKRYNDNH
jgi:hypothetical protein